MFTYCLNFEHKFSTIFLIIHFPYLTLIESAQLALLSRSKNNLNVQ